MSEPVSGITQGLKVGIVGGSIAGCTTAIELLRLGCEVTLFERTGEELKDRGAGIGVPPSVIDTFIRRDLVDADTPYFPSHTFTRLWRTGQQRRYGYLAWDQPAKLALLNWGVLYRNLRKRVPNQVYQTEHRVVALHGQDNGSVSVELADGSRHAFDLVVCADGYTSLGRRTLFPQVTIQYAGYVLWRGFMKIGLGYPALWAGRKSPPAVGGPVLKEPHGTQTDQSCGLRYEIPFGVDP